MNLRIVFKFKNCKLQFYEKRRLFCYFSVNPCMPASCWRRLLKLKRKKKTGRLFPHKLDQQFINMKQLRLECRMQNDTALIMVVTKD